MTVMNYTQAYVNNYFSGQQTHFYNRPAKKKKKKKKNLALSTVGFCPPLNKLLKNKDKKINLWTARGQQTHFCTVEVMHSI